MPMLNLTLTRKGAPVLAFGALGLGALWGVRLLPGSSAASAGQPAAHTKAGQSAGDVFGYTEAFEKELQKIGQISPQEFARLYPTGAGYLGQISWDPTTAKYWDEFNKDPQKSKHGFGRDFRLNE